MRFTSQGHRIYREPNEPLRINVDFVLVDIHPSEVDKIAEVLATLEKILDGVFELVSSTNKSDYDYKVK